MALVTFKPAMMNFPSLIDTFFPVAFENNKNTGSFHPATNIYELEKSYVLEMNVPGRKKEDFKIAVENDLLTISYEKPSETPSDKKTIRKEFGFPSFKRSFSLDETIDIENISAQYENGILSLNLPRKEEVKPAVKQIAIS